MWQLARVEVAFHAVLLGFDHEIDSGALPTHTGLQQNCVDNRG